VRRQAQVYVSKLWTHDRLLSWYSHQSPKYAIDRNAYWSAICLHLQCFLHGADLHIKYAGNNTYVPTLHRIKAVITIDKNHLILFMAVIAVNFF
jgi:hypothetical protein